MDRREMMMLSLGTLPGFVSRQAPEPAGGEPAALPASAGELVYVGRDPVRIKISPSAGKGRFAMITQGARRQVCHSLPALIHDLDQRRWFTSSPLSARRQ